MSSSTSAKRSKRQFLQDIFRRSEVSPSDSQSNLKENLGIAGRFAQALLKKLPECVDDNPAKMALSIVKTIIQIKDEIGDNKDSLAQGLQKTKSVLDQVATAGVPESEEFKQEIESYRIKIETEKMKLSRLTDKLKSNFQNLDYENYKKMIEGICRNIDGTTELFMLKMQLSIRKTTAQIHKDIKKASLNGLDPARKADYKTVLQGQSLKREACTKGTRVKILETISEWANDRTLDSPPVFWLTGQGGSGKTTIAYTIAKHFEDGQPTVLGANFLCSRQFEETRIINRVLPTIVYQLAHKSESYEAALHAQVTDKSAALNYSFSDQMNELLVGPWCNTRPSEVPFLVVIDALDEIEDNEGSTLLATLLTTVKNHDLAGLKFLVTSRTDPNIVDLCNTFPLRTICRLQDVPVAEAESDIKTYLEVKLPNVVGSPELAELRGRASGLFIFAATAVRILTQVRSITHKEQIRMLQLLLTDLSSVTKDKPAIDQLYEHIMYNAFSGLPKPLLTPRLRILFTFLCAAERISTSVAALLTDDDCDMAQAVVNDLHAVLYIQGDRIFWYHTSFPDFIFARSRSQFRIGGQDVDFWCDTTAQHHFLAASCFRVMKSDSHGLRFNVGDIPSSYLLDSEHSDELIKHIDTKITPVLSYSSFYWAHHLVLPLGIDTKDDLRHCISDFLQIRVVFWIEVMSLLGTNSACSRMLNWARQCILIAECENSESTLARDLSEAANFATYFAGSPAAESTPHLYISSLATWQQGSSLSQNWKKQFSRIPLFTNINGGMDIPLLTIHAVLPTPLLTVTYSSNGRCLLAVSEGSVRVWSASSGRKLDVLEGDAGIIYSAVFSNDNTRIASGSQDHSVRLWDLRTNEVKVLKGHSMVANTVAFSNDGTRIVSGADDESIRVWDVSTGAALKVLKGHTGRVNSVAFSSNGSLIVSGSHDHTVRIWDARLGKELKMLHGHIDRVCSVVFSVNDAWVVSGSYDRSVRIWDTQTSTELKLLSGHTDSVNSVAVSMDGAYVASGSDDGSVRVWDVSTGDVLKVLKGHTNPVNTVAFSSDNTRILSSCDDSVQVWNASTTTKFKKLLKGYTGHLISMALSKDGKRVGAGFEDGSVLVWDTSTGQVIDVLKGLGDVEAVISVAFSNDGTKIVFGSEDTYAWLWDLAMGGVVKVLEGHTNYVCSVAFSSDDVQIVSGSEDRSLRVWDTAMGEELMVLKGHTNSVLSVVFSADGHKIVSGSADHSVRVWDAQTGIELNVLAHSSWVTSVAVSNDGARIVSGSDDGLIGLWDTSTGEMLQLMKGHIAGVFSVAFSTDDTRIVSGSDDEHIRIWDTLTGKEMKVLEGHYKGVNSVAFSEDGTWVISGSSDGLLIIWGLDGPSWTLAASDWVLSSPENDLLMWVAPEAQLVRQSNCRVVSGPNWSIVDIDKSMTGPNWQKCYTPTHLAP